MYFSDEKIKELADKFRAVDSSADKLTLDYLTHDFKNKRAREFAHHGFVRRIEMLKHCIKNVFVFLPPEKSDVPAMDDCTEATVYIQAFLFNVFGALDNLAWIWVEEKKIRNQDGNQLPERQVGLAKHHKKIRRTFSPEFRDYLEEQTDWFKHLADFRHALAHRIPLYIPRYCILNEDEYNRIQTLKDAVRDNPEEYSRLAEEQMTWVQFWPVMLHSISGGSPRIVFHPQLLSDFAIVDQIGSKMLAELARDIPPQSLPAPGLLDRVRRCLARHF